MKQDPTIADVANAVGVAKSTISNFLNGRSARISEETSDRIRKAIKDLGYVPRLGARAILGTRQTKTVAVLLRHNLESTFSNQFMIRALPTLSRRAEELGYRVILVPLISEPESLKREKEELGDYFDTDLDWVRSLGRGIVDGFLLFDIENQDDYLIHLDRAKMPFLAFGHPHNGGNFPWIAADHRYGIEMACRYLFKRGCERVFIFPGRMGTALSTERVRGCEDAFSSFGKIYQREDAFYFSNSVEGYACLDKLLASFELGADTVDEGSNDLGKSGPLGFILPQELYFLLLDGSPKLAQRPDSLQFVLSDFFPTISSSFRNLPPYVETPIDAIVIEGLERLIEMITGEKRTDEGAGIGTNENLFPVQLILPDGTAFTG